MTAWAHDVDGWLVGEVDDDTPASTPIAPPEHGQAAEPGAPWPRWHRFEWRFEDYPQPAVAAVPDEVERWQLRCALISTGRLQAVIDALGTIQNPKARAIAAAQFEHRPTLRRVSPFTQQLQQLAGITDEERDQLFVLAASL